MDIKYKTQVQFVGRNGLFKQTGITINQPFMDGVIVIHPITSRDILGNCTMEIPVEDVPSVIAALQQAARPMGS